MDLRFQALWFLLGLEMAIVIFFTASCRCHFGHDAVAGRCMIFRCFTVIKRIAGTQCFRLPGDIHRHIIIHLDHGICNMEKGTRASCNQDRGNPCFFKKILCSFQKWGNGLLFPADHLLHKAVTNHEIGGRGVLIQEKYPASSLHSFHNSSRLGSASAGILCGKTVSVLFIGQIIDEQGNIHIFYKSSILRTKLLGSNVCDHVLSAISCNMVINTQLQGIEQSGFSVIATAYDQRDSCRNPHTCNFPLVRQLHGNTQTIRRGKCHTVSHRP